MIKFDPTVGVQMAFQDQIFCDFITTVRVQVSFKASIFSNLVTFGSSKSVVLQSCEGPNGFLNVRSVFLNINIFDQI